MTFNAIGYILFLAVIFYITIWVGWVFYKNGEHYLHSLFEQDAHLVNAINRILLLGYYLLNLGYASWSLSSWEKLLSLEELIVALSTKLGIMIAGLAIMHYFNLFWLLMYSHWKEKNKINTNVKLNL